MSSKTAVTKKAAKKAARKRQPTPKVSKPKKTPHYVLAFQSESKEVLDGLREINGQFAKRLAAYQQSDAEFDERVKRWEQSLVEQQKIAIALCDAGCCCPVGEVTMQVVGSAAETLPQTLALRTADIDYDGWEAVAMVGVDGITDERRGRRGRRGLFAALQSDNYKRRLAVLHIRERYEADEAAGGIKAAAEGGRFQQILQWMIDHREEILAFIQMIVGLFSQVPV